MLTEPRLGFYPPIEPFRRGRLDVGDGHAIYYEQCGNVRGVPVLMVHGGPGGGINPTMRRFHDPALYNIVLFDQRGAGLSQPHASLDHNTTWHLIADMEKLRRHLNIEQWQLFGGSWGSTLSLLYAEAYPERVSSMILRSIFLLRRSELAWFYENGANWVFPDAYRDFIGLLRPEERSNPIGAYYTRLTHEDPSIQLQAARCWSRWEGSTLSLLPEPERLKLFEVDRYALAFARIECHYFHHGGFLARDTQILDEIDRVKHIPGIIVHGRYDMVTPIKNAFDLHASWPRSHLMVVPDAGHAMTEAGMIDALVRAARAFGR